MILEVLDLIFKVGFSDYISKLNSIRSSMSLQFTNFISFMYLLKMLRHAEFSVRISLVNILLSIVPASMEYKQTLTCSQVATISKKHLNISSRLNIYICELSHGRTFVYLAMNLEIYSTVKCRAKISLYHNLSIIIYF